MTDKTKGVLDAIVDRFKNGEIPEAVAYTSFPIPNIPSQRWSFLNQILQFFSRTQDGRGYRQWIEAKRQVVKGAKAFYILVPRFKIENKGTDDKKSVLAGFLVSPVFRVEDTEGEPLEYMNLKLPDLPLIERATQWGIKTIPIAGNPLYYGYYSPERKVIALATPEEKTFFHELAHVAHDKLLIEFKKGEDPIQEIVAELSALTLCKLVGKSSDTHFGNSYQYIEKYAKELDVSPYRAVIQVINDVRGVVNLILGGTNDLNKNIDSQSVQAV